MNHVPSLKLLFIFYCRPFLILIPWHGHSAVNTAASFYRHVTVLYFFVKKKKSKPVASESRGSGETAGVTGDHVAVIERLGGF